MSKYKIKGTLDDNIKSVEYNRGFVPQLQDLKTLFERRFGGGSIALRYKFADGRVQALYQDSHVLDAIRDCEKSGTRTLVLSLNHEGSSYSSSSSSSNRASTSGLKPSYSSSSFNSPAPSSHIRSPSGSTSSPSSSSSKFCEMCGATLGPAVKFCSSCGHSSSQGPSSSPSHSTSSSSLSSGPTCAGCHLAVTSSAVKALDKVWHKECFICKRCRKSLLEGAFAPSDDGTPYCSNCYEEQYGSKCGKCHKAISGAYLSVDGREYHKECFVCNNCGNQFEGGYFMKNGKAFCKNCL